MSNEQKMREALAWCARALDKDHPAAIAAREALAEQPAQGEADVLDDMADTIRDLLAEVERLRAQGEPVGYIHRLIVEGQTVGTRYVDCPHKAREIFGKPGRDHGGTETVTAVYTAPPATSVPDEMWAGPPHTVDYVNGWNACREAVLAAAPEVPRG